MAGKSSQRNNIIPGRDWENPYCDGEPHGLPVLSNVWWKNLSFDFLEPRIETSLLPGAWRTESNDPQDLVKTASDHKASLSQDQIIFSVLLHWDIYIYKR